MSNKNRNLANGNGTERKEEKKSWIKQKLEKVNVKSVAKTCCKAAVGFCALVGAAGLGSYAADQIGKPNPKTQIPDVGTNTDLDA